MERPAQSLGIESRSASQASEITKDLNEHVEWFRTCPLEKEYPVIWVDALYEKVRCERHVISMAVAVIKGLTSEGKGAHSGLKNAIQKCFLGASWQWCKVHFMRNILVHALLEEGLEDSLQFLTFPRTYQRKIASTNPLERIHKEIRRRTRVVGIFPTTDSYLRLVTNYRKRR